MSRSDLPLPNWPGLMDTATASAYLSMSEASLRLLAHRVGVTPVDCGGLSMTRWRRRDLDAMIDSLPQRDGTVVAQASVVDDAAAALERVRRRAEGQGPCST